MTLRRGGPQFTTSSRAIVLPSHDELYEEFCMPQQHMIGRTSVDGVMNALCVLLQTAGAEVVGHDHRQFKVTFQGKTCYLPAKFAGDRTKSLIKERLGELGLQRTLDGLDEEASQVIADGLKKAGFKDVTPPPGKLFGIELSDGSTYFAEQLAQSMAADVDAMVQKRAEEIAETSEWQALAEKNERLLIEARHERDAAVRDLVRQRDEALQIANELRAELDGVRRSLAGLAPLFQKET